MERLEDPADQVEALGVSPGPLSIEVWKSRVESRYFIEANGTIQA